jgi:hypothetical protein
MSLETWKQEFYPEPADECSAERAVAHSILKWTGLLKENLKKHNVWRKLGEWNLTSINDERFTVASDSCALCYHYLEPADEEETPCKRCPLYQVRDEVSCDNFKSGEFYPPFGEWLHQDKPEVMLDWLKQIKEEA